jgi:hypothetical protein
MNIYILIFFIIVKQCFLLSYDIGVNPQDWEGISNGDIDATIMFYVKGYLFPWIFGASASGFKIVSNIVLVLDIAIILIVVFRIYVFESILKSFPFYMLLLTLFTIWIEPWVSIFMGDLVSITQLIADLFAKGVFFVGDCFFSVVWWLAMDSVSRTFRNHL